MNTYSIVNYMKAGTNFAGLCVFAAPIINAIKIAKRDPELIPGEMNDFQIIESFGRKMSAIDAMREMWNALNPNDRWNYTDYNQFCKHMWEINAKYRRMEQERA